ncbi:MAG: class E sortase [Candidatus Gracilibacteria bacterium]|nr:class E sortase [Candidatus Gracilibacteria bacterium]
MHLQQTPTNTLDILALLDREEIIASNDVSIMVDPLNLIENPSVEIFTNKESKNISRESLLTRFRRASVPKIQFMFYYLSISAIVFVVLLATTNWNSYSTLLSAYINPQGLTDSKNDIISVLDKSRVTVYADNSVDIGANEEEQTSIRKKLEESNTSVREDRFSPKRLISLEAKMNIDLDITPYDNRIIIPKIGKNIPLVDVRLDAGFDFDHIENIFMQELEKGVVRYPGTAKPGETGNTFIFGHSSNYPWVKGEYNSVFALLDELTFGDEIIVYYNQKKFTYIIREKKVVKPGNVKILERGDTKKEISLMTCWPIGTTLNRLIIFAELQEEK